MNRSRLIIVTLFIIFFCPEVYAAFDTCENAPLPDDALIVAVKENRKCGVKRKSGNKVTYYNMFTMEGVGQIEMTICDNNLVAPLDGTGYVMVEYIARERCNWRLKKGSSVVKWYHKVKVRKPTNATETVCQQTPSSYRNDTIPPGYRVAQVKQDRRCGVRITRAGQPVEWYKAMTLKKI